MWGPAPGLTSSSRSQDFPILHLDGIVEDSSNILGFSMFNTSHPFYPEFVRSLNMSWRENCEASTYPGPAVSALIPPTHRRPAHRHFRGPLQTSVRWCSEPSGTLTRFPSTCQKASQCGPEKSLTCFLVSTSHAALATLASSWCLCCPSTHVLRGLFTLFPLLCVHFHRELVIPSLIAKSLFKCPLGCKSFLDLSV